MALPLQFGVPWLPHRRLSSRAALESSGLQQTSSEQLRLACPICFQPFRSGQDADLSPLAMSYPRFTCDCCNKEYASSSKGIIDLTIPAPTATLGTSFFQNPLLAYAYERGYRDLFWIFNFPGFAEEFKMAQARLEPARGGTIMDLSCAGGSFTRMFVSSNEYKMVVASDYSQSMLEECRSFLDADEKTDMRNTILLRADAARLPLANASLSAVHSGAAIHCWPQPAIAVAEVARVLQPGGIFVASTFLLGDLPSLLEDLSRPARQAIMQLQLPFKLWSEADLREIVESSGLTELQMTKRGRYILFSAKKRL